MDKAKVFKSVLSGFETNLIKKYCINMIRLSPDIIFEMPSSTTLKYHNATQCKAGGQLYHIIMVAEIMNDILSLQYMKEKYPDPLKRDALRCAAILHDMQKTEGGKFTTHTHPLAAQKWILETKPQHDIPQKWKIYISELVSTHSGQWRTSNKDNTLLPEIKNDDQFLVHVCDYLGSRTNLDMIYDAKTIDTVNQFQNKNEKSLTMPFGKYKNMRIEDLDKNYLASVFNKYGYRLDVELKNKISEILNIKNDTETSILNQLEDI